MRVRLHFGRLAGAVLITAGLALLASCQSQADTPATIESATEEMAEVTVAPQATATPTPAPTASPTPADTATPAPSATAEPTETVMVEETATPNATNGDDTFSPAANTAVVPHGPPGSWDSQFTDPGAVVYHDGLFHMFHNGFVGWPAPVGIAYSTSPDGYTWTRVQEEPVFRGDDLDYVGLTALASSALVEDDGTWVLYFYTWDQPTWPGAPSSIGRATAPEPLGPWTADAAPVLLPGPQGAWDDEAVRAPSVLHTDDGYVMYYAGFDRLQGLIGMATSPDGVQWTKFDDAATTEERFVESDPIFEPGADDAWDADHVFHPRVVLTPAGYVMVYSAAPRLNATSTLGYALSEDGVNWQRAAQPILDYTAVPGGRAIWFSALEYLDGTYFLFFELGTGGETEVYLATAEDLGVQ